MTHNCDKDDHKLELFPGFGAVVLLQTVNRVGKLPTTRLHIGAAYRRTCLVHSEVKNGFFTIQASTVSDELARTKNLLFVGLLSFVVLNGCANLIPPTGGEPQIPEPVVETAFPGQDLTWTESVPSPVALYESQGLAANGSLYVFGGYDNEQIQASLLTLAFNPATERWRNLAPMPEKITHAGQALYDNKVYLAGGFVGDHPGPATSHVWIYDIAADTWAVGPALPEKIGGGALVSLEGRLHFFGGAVRQGFTYLQDSSQHWVLDVAAGSTTWVEAAALPNPRNHIAGASLNGKIYAVGGQHLGDEESGNQPHVNVYDPASDRWERVADLPQPLGHISAATFAHSGRLVVVMGTTQEGKTQEIVAYNPAADRWDNLTNMPGARSATVAGVIGGEIVLATGTVGGSPLDTTWTGSWTDD